VLEPSDGFRPRGRTIASVAYMRRPPSPTGWENRSRLCEEQEPARFSLCRAGRRGRSRRSFSIRRQRESMIALPRKKVLRHRLHGPEDKAPSSPSTASMRDCAGGSPQLTLGEMTIAYARRATTARTSNHDVAANQALAPKEYMPPGGGPVSGSAPRRARLPLGGSPRGELRRDRAASRSCGCRRRRLSHTRRRRSRPPSPVCTPRRRPRT